MQLRQKIIITYVSIAAFFITCVAAIGFYTTYTNLRATLISEMDAKVSTFSENYNSWLISKSTKVDTTANIIANNLDAENKKRYLQIFKDDPEMSALFLALPQDGSIIDGGDWVATGDYDARTRPFYTSALEKEGLAFSLTYPDENNNYLATLSFSKPIRYPSGLLYAVIAGETRLNSLNAFAKKLSIKEDGFGFVVDNYGVVLAHSKEDTYLGKLLESIPGYDLLSQDISQADKGLLTYKIDGVSYTLSYGTMSLTGWKTVLLVPKKVIYKPLYKIGLVYLLVTSFGILVMILSVGFFTNRIVNPILRFTKSASSISNGDFTTEVPFIKEGEMGKLSRAFGKMTIGFRDIIHGVLDLCQDITTSSDDFSQTYSQNTTIAEEVTKTIEMIADTASQQAELSDRGFHRSSSLYENAKSNIGSLEELTASSQEIQYLTDEGLNIMEELSTLTSEGQVSIDAVYRDILNTNESSEQISKASSMISSIAAQTNLLALNAAIEAARAGESGRGFAVVAEEIRSLAEQASSSTKEIDASVTQLKDHSSTTVNTIHQVLALIKKQHDSVQQTYEQYEVMSAAMTEMSNLINMLKTSGDTIMSDQKEIYEIIKELSNIAEENAAATEQASAMTEEQSASMEESLNQINRILELSVSLRDSISQYKI